MTQMWTEAVYRRAPDLPSGAFHGNSWRWFNCGSRKLATISFTKLNESAKWQPAERIESIVVYADVNQCSWRTNASSWYLARASYIFFSKLKKKKLHTLEAFQSVSPLFVPTVKISRNEILWIQDFFGWNLELYL